MVLIPIPFCVCLLSADQRRGRKKRGGTSGKKKKKEGRGGKKGGLMLASKSPSSQARYFGLVGTWTAGRGREK